MFFASEFTAYCVTVAKIGGAIVGVVAAFGVLAKSPAGTVVRWLYVQLAGEPVGEWFRYQVRLAAEEVVDEKLLTRNGGTTIPDVSARLDALTTQVRANHDENVRQHAENSGRLDLIEVNGRAS